MRSAWLTVELASKWRSQMAPPPTGTRVKFRSSELRIMAAKVPRRIGSHSSASGASAVADLGATAVTA
jgi:hypothetical protein